MPPLDLYVFDELDGLEGDELRLELELEPPEELRLELPELPEPLELRLLLPPLEELRLELDELRLELDELWLELLWLELWEE